MNYSFSVEFVGEWCTPSQSSTYIIHNKSGNDDSACNEILSWLIRSVCSAARHALFSCVCSCRRRSCKGAVLSDTSHPVLITLTHCYSRWLSGTASVQHSHTRQLRLLTPPVETVVRWDKKIRVCVCERWTPHPDYITSTSVCTSPALIHTEIQTGIQRH